MATNTSNIDGMATTMGNLTARGESCPATCNPAAVRTVRAANAAAGTTIQAIHRCQGAMIDVLTASEAEAVDTASRGAAVPVRGRVSDRAAARQRKAATASAATSPAN